MLKLKMSIAALGVLALTAPVASAQAAIVGPDSAVCEQGSGPAALVRVSGFKARSGVLRVQLYGSNPDDFLAKGKKLKRIDLPVAASGAMDVCVALPHGGNYAVAVRHDLDGDGKSGWNDGGGFSRNPRLSLTRLKPDYEDVVITIGSDVRPVNVVLNYRQGLSIRPISLASM